MLLSVGSTAGDKRALERDSLDRGGHGTPMAYEGFVGVQIAAKDVDTEVGIGDGRAHEGDKAVPVTHTSVELVFVPRLAMFW